MKIARAAVGSAPGASSAAIIYGVGKRGVGKRTPRILA